MQYEVLKNFYDKEDNLQLYGTGGLYPRESAKPTKERIQELVGLGYIKDGENGRSNDDVDTVGDNPDDDMAHGPVEDEAAEVVMSEENSKQEIMDHLDDLEIDYKTSETKKELLALLDDSNDSAD